MAGKRYKPEEIVSVLRQAEVLHGQGLSMVDAIRQLGIPPWHDHEICAICVPVRASGRSRRPRDS